VVGLHVLVEKPIAASAVEAQTLINLAICRRNRRVIRRRG
jgi:predicted dehydrogenase